MSQRSLRYGPAHHSLQHYNQRLICSGTGSSTSVPDALTQRRTRMITLAKADNQDLSVFKDLNTQMYIMEQNLYLS
ncbi:UNVERIFIED_CONTAM: hypothetical protein PYX00_005682 [Menopon gallinae]|uniref:Uncharacterized protein n=1 Tax=Menopon gallinae TaxID=328185 RepID=A0AAW2HSH7_9NEOP